MDPPSPTHRDLVTEEIIENIIHDASRDGMEVERADSPSSYLNPSGDGMEVERSENQGDDSDDGDRESSDDGEAGRPSTKSGEVYI